MLNSVRNCATAAKHDNFSTAAGRMLCKYSLNTSTTRCPMELDEKSKDRRDTEVNQLQPFTKELPDLICLRTFRDCVHKNFLNFTVCDQFSR